MRSRGPNSAETSNMEGHANASEMQERIAEQTQEREAYAAGYSSAEQARAATELAQVWQAHKKIDTELAGRAKAMLKEMVDAGGDLDLEKVRAITDEAERRYAAAENEITEQTPREAARPVENETQFLRVEPRARVEAVAPRETAAQKDAAMWETWRAHLRDKKVVSEDGMDIDLVAAQKMGLSKDQAEQIARLQAAQYIGVRGRGSERGARNVVDIPKDNYGPSNERGALQQQRDVAMQVRDGLARRVRTVQQSERAAVQQQLQAAEASLAQIEAAMRAAG